MNQNNFIYLLVSVLLAFTACSNEELIEKHPDGNYTSKLNITLSTASAITKAGEQQELFPATDQEKTIKSCVLAIFKKEGSTYTKKAIIEPELEKTDTEGFYNVVSDVELLFSETYKIVIIANGDLRLYSECKTYDDLKEITEGNTGKNYAFKSDELLKWGEKEVGVSTGTDLTVNTQFHLDLTQLAARIDLKLNVELGEKKFLRSYYEFEEGGSLVEMGNLTREKLKMEPYRGKETTGKDADLSGKNLYYQGRKIQIKNVASANCKFVFLDDYTAFSVKEYDSWTIDLDEIIVKNIRTNVIAVLPRRDYSNWLLPIYELSRLGNSSIEYVTFYTYERSASAMKEDKLHVEFSGKIYRATIKERKKVTSDFWFVNAQTQDIYNKVVNTLEDPVILEETGWGADKLMFPLDLHDEDYNEVEGTDAVVESTKVLINRNYTSGFDIPETSAPIAYGNYYKVTAFIRNVTKPVSCDWEILPWSIKDDVTIEFK